MFCLFRPLVGVGLWGNSPELKPTTSACGIFGPSWCEIGQFFETQQPFFWLRATKGGQPKHLRGMSAHFSDKTIPNRGLFGQKKTGGLPVFFWGFRITRGAIPCTLSFFWPCSPKIGFHSEPGRMKYLHKGASTSPPLARGLLVHGFDDPKPYSDVIFFLPRFREIYVTFGF